MIVIGIDPGITGAIALLDHIGGMTIEDLPVLKIKRAAKTKSIVDVSELSRWINGLYSHAFIEMVGSRPGQSTQSTSTAWMNYGRILGCLETLNIAITEVSPAKWKKALGVPSEKDGARFRASQILPQCSHYWDRKKDHGRAEAALIALYGQRELNKK